jgi:prepilin-type N-terminal cleavage/methylation domain-containing protein
MVQPGINIKNHLGLSLVESLIAIVILGIVMAGGMAFYYNSNALYYRGLHLQLATWTANSKIEQIKNAGCTATAVETGTTVSLSGDSTDTNHLTGTRKILWPTTTTKPVTCASSNDVVVQVTWTEPGDSLSRQVSLETYIGT